MTEEIISIDLSGIELKIIEQLKAKQLNVSEYEIKEDVAGIIKTPCVRVAIEAGEFKKIGQKSFKQNITIVLVVIFEHAASEEHRRKGIYPLIQGIVQYLMLQKFGLKIDALEPKKWTRVTLSPEYAKVYLAYELKFESGFYIEKMDDEEEIDDLLRIGMNYYLKPGDDVEDASDDIELDP